MTPYASLPPSALYAEPHQQSVRDSAGPYCGTKSLYTEPPRGASAIRPPRDTNLVHVSLIARHGTRNPTERGLKRMRQLEIFLRHAAPHLPWLTEWNRVLTGYEVDEGRLTEHGEAEMRSLGQRFRKRYSRLLSAPGTEPAIAWASSKRRAVQSAVFFLEGYEDAAPKSPSAPKKDPGQPTTHVFQDGEDAVVHYTKRHIGYTNFSQRHKESVLGALISGKTKRGTEIADRMARNLGIPDLRPDYVRVIAEAAAFDLAHGRESTSPFARLLEPSDSNFLEAFDRAYRPFWEGTARYRAVAAPLVRELDATLKLAQAGKAPVADLKFAHAQTLIPLLLLFGIEGNGLCPQRGDHIPGLSAMSPFAANFCLELFATKTCRGQQRPRFLVRFRLHERYIASVPALGEHGRDGIVPLEKLLDFFQGVIDEDNKYQQQAQWLGSKSGNGTTAGYSGKAQSPTIHGHGSESPNGVIENSGLPEVPSGHGHGSMVPGVPAVVPVPTPSRVFEQRVVE